MKKDFLSIIDLSKDEVLHIIALAVRLKKGKKQKLLLSKSLVAIYEKPSLRTRLSFERAMHQLGGATFSYDGRAIGLGVREPINDMAYVIASMADAIALRVNEHSTLVQFAKYAKVPVINALSDVEHPCQILADLLTIHEVKGRLTDLTITFIGDCNNNVAHSLALASAMLGISFRCVSPKTYCLDKTILSKVSMFKDASITETTNLKEALKGTDVIVTDTWISMGDEGEEDVRLKVFEEFQVNTDLMKLAKPDAMFLHCMPVYRGNEVTSYVVDGEQSFMYQEAENRLHAQKALLVHLLS